MWVVDHFVLSKHIIERKECVFHWCEKERKADHFINGSAFLTAIAALSFPGGRLCFLGRKPEAFQSISSGNIDPYFSNYELDPTNNEQEGLQIIREGGCDYHHGQSATGLSGNPFL